MDQHPDNPSGNILGAGVSDADLLSAIIASGYPLQSIAVDKIVGQLDDLIEYPEDRRAGRSIKYSIQEEWSYIDADSGEARNLDALIGAYIPTESGDPSDPIASNPQSTLRHHLEFLLECKQSELPYVFFLRSAPTGDVPRLVGLPYEDLSIAVDDYKEFEFGMSTYDVLGLYELPLAQEPVTAIAMSKAHRKGSKLELSGEDAFRAITLPLVKALKYYSQIITPKSEDRLYHDIRVIIPLAVLNAPMVGVRMIEGEARIEAIPWVRLVRVDPGEDLHRAYINITSIDVVHIDYLEEFVRFAHDAAVEVARRINAFTVPILTGEAINSFREDSGAESESVTEEMAVHEPPPYTGMVAHQSDEEFMNDWRRRSREIHSPRPPSSKGES
jgi:hypothetical protein